MMPCLLMLAAFAAEPLSVADLPPQIVAETGTFPAPRATGGTPPYRFEYTLTAGGSPHRLRAGAVWNDAGSPLLQSLVKSPERMRRHQDAESSDAEAYAVPAPVWIRVTDAAGRQATRTQTITLVVPLDIAWEAWQQRKLDRFTVSLPTWLPADPGTLPMPTIEGGRPPFTAFYRVGDRRAEVGDAFTGGPLMVEAIGRGHGYDAARFNQPNLADRFAERAGRRPRGAVVFARIEAQVASESGHRSPSGRQWVALEVPQAGFEAAMAVLEAKLRSRVPNWDAKQAKAAPYRDRYPTQTPDEVLRAVEAEARRQKRIVRNAALQRAREDNRQQQAAAARRREATAESAALTQPPDWTGLPAMVYVGLVFGTLLKAGLMAAAGAINRVLVRRVGHVPLGRAARDTAEQSPDSAGATPSDEPAAIGADEPTEPPSWGRLLIAATIATGPAVLIGTYLAWLFRVGLDGVAPGHPTAMRILSHAVVLGVQFAFMVGAMRLAFGVRGRVLVRYLTVYYALGLSLRAGLGLGPIALPAG